MNQTLKILILLLSTYIYGCGTQNKTKEIEWKEKNLVGEIYSCDSSIFLSHLTHPYENGFLMGSATGENKLVSLNINPSDKTISLKKILIKNGRGAGEFVSANSKYTSGESFLITDSNTSEGFMIDMSKDVENKELWHSVAISAVGYVSDLCPIDDNNFLTMLIGTTGPQMFYKYHLGDSAYTPLNFNYPTNVTDNNNILPFLYIGNIYKQPNGNRFVYTSKDIGHITYIFEIIGNDIKIIHKISDELQPCKIDTKDEGIKKDIDGQFGFPLYATNKYIYILERVKTMRGIIDKTPYPAMYGTVIKSYDWDGNPNIKYVLDKPIDFFSISADDGKVYGKSINEDTEEDILVISEL